MILTRAGMVAFLRTGSRLRLLSADGVVVSERPYQVDGTGRVLVTEDAQAPGGAVSMCDIVTETGEVLATGSVGLPGSDADVELDHLDIQPGSRVEQTGSLTDG